MTAGINEIINVALPCIVLITVACMRTGWQMLAEHRLNTGENIIHMSFPRSACVQLQVTIMTLRLITGVLK
jgi:hypothetical protein